MQVAVVASNEQWQELTGSRPAITWLRVAEATVFLQYPEADAYLNLNTADMLPVYTELRKPVMIHSVTGTLAELKTPSNVCRINAWPGFLQRPVWEIAGNIDDRMAAIFRNIPIRMQVVKDEPGFIAARVIAMIINEAYLALEDGVSTRVEIDTAMKLGTNYPLGPFEWATRIGVANIYELLKKLCKESPRYTPAALLINEAEQKK